MARIMTLQTNCSAGELDPALHWRQDTDQYRNGAKSLHNRRCLIGGGTVRRPGTLRQAELSSRPRAVEWLVNQTTQYVIVLTDGRFDAFSRNATTGALTFVQTLTGCAWTDDIWREADVVRAGNVMFVVHEEMAPQKISRTDAGVFSVADLTFDSGPASRPEQPYYKFAPADMTLTCSDVTGSITLTVSGSTAWFTSVHVGTYIRYHGRACLVTAVASDGLSCTATVVERLPETYSLTVGSSTGFSVGELVEGSATGAKGLVTAIADGTHVTVVLTDSLIAFTTSDTLISPEASSAVSGVATTTNAAVSDWDEQMFSDVWGYPGCVELHRTRLCFGGHLTAPNVFLASALRSPYNFNVGDGSDADAIIETIGDDAASRIVQLHSAEQMLVATDAGLYYIPESAAAPFRPSSVAFFPFGSPWPISPRCSHVPFDGGVLFVSDSTVIKATPTGDVNQSWDAEEVSMLSAHLFNTPTTVAVVSSFANGPERYAVFCNTDGTLAVMQLVEKQKIRNVTPWETDRDPDIFTSVVGIQSSLYATAIRQVAGNTIYTLELFDQNVTLDFAVELDDLDDTPDTFGNSTVNIVTDNGLHLGTYPPSLDEIPEGPYTVGFLYSSEIELLPPIIEDSEGSHAGEFMRILEALVFVRSSARFAVNGYELTAYQSTDDLSEPPPLKNGPQRFQFLGWTREPTLLITHTDPLAVEISAIKTQVAY